MADFAKAVETVLKHEGGFVNDAADPGGATNFGISLRSALQMDLNADGKVDKLDWDILDLDQDGDLDAEDIKKLTADSAKAVYFSQFWERYHYDRFHSQEVASKIFDLAVHCGPRQAHKLLQMALNSARGADLCVDGLLGTLTLSVANGTATDDLLAELRAAQVRFYRQVVTARPRMVKFLNGWIARAESC